MDDPGAQGAVSLAAIIVLAIGIGIGVLVVYKYPETFTVLKESLRTVSFEHKAFGYWDFILPAILLVLIVIFFTIAFWYAHTYGQYTSSPKSIQTLLTIRRHDLSTAIQSLAINNSYQSICKKLEASTPTAPYSSIVSKNQTALVNWRPMTVRLAGYLGGTSSALNGVFDMTMGIKLALEQGARAFVFDIDYLEVSPCSPVLIHRDSNGVMRSLHVGSIKEGCEALRDNAFTNNNDPVIIILYIRRYPSTPGSDTFNRFFMQIAASLSPIASYHLGSSAQGTFYNCANEAHLFTSPITNYEQKFIVLTNYNTIELQPTPNPKDNLHFWTNARIWLDPNGVSSSLGEVTKSVPSGQSVYAQVGAMSQLLNIGSGQPTTTYQESYSSAKFCIALTDINPSPPITTANLNTLFNVLGIQCVPIDVIALAANPIHASTTIKYPKSLTDLAVYTNANDLLSFWAMEYGWSRKLMIGDTTTGDNIPITPIVPIPGYTITQGIPAAPPSSSTNAAGGTLSSIV